MTPFALAEDITVDLNPGGQINVVTSTELTLLARRERSRPASIGLLSGIVLVAGGLIRRKQKSCL
jgi:hypothetical protein